MDYDDIFDNDDFFSRLKIEEYSKKIFSDAAIQIYAGMKQVGGVLRWCHLYTGKHDKLSVLNKLLTHFESTEEYEICAELKSAIGVLNFQNILKSKKIKSV